MQKKPSLYPETVYPEKNCFRCHTTYGLHKHHIAPGSGRRSISEREGLWLYLCGYHHNLSNDSVHFNKDYRDALQRDAQRRWEEREGVTDHEAFIKVFGESFIRD